MKKINEKKPKYGMRKLSIGFVSCMLGFTMMFTPIANLGGIVARTYAQAVDDWITPNPEYNGKRIHVSEPAGSQPNSYNSLVTAINNAEDGDIIELDTDIVDTVTSEYNINKRVRIVGNGHQLAIRANSGAKINITSDVTIENLELSSRISSQGEFPIVVKSEFFKMDGVTLTNGGTGEKFSLFIQPLTSDKSANIIVTGNRATDFDKIEVGEDGQPLASNIQLKLYSLVSSRDGLRINNYTQIDGKQNTPVITDKSKVTKFNSMNPDNDSTLIIDGINKNISLSNIKNVELINNADIALDDVSLNVSKTNFNIPGGTRLNLSNLDEDVSLASIVVNPDQNIAGTISVAFNSKLTVKDTFNPSTKIKVENVNNVSTFTLELSSPLDKNPNIVIMEGKTKITRTGNTYKATVGQDEAVSERLQYVIVEGDDIEVERGDSHDKILEKINEKLKSNIKTENVEAISTNPAIIDTNTPTPEGQQGESVEVTFRDKNNTNDTAKVNVHIKILPGEVLRDVTLQEKINKALENLTEITIEHGKTDEDLKEKVRQELEKTADTQGVTIDTVTPQNTGNTVNEAGSNVTFNFTKDSENASKEILVKVVKNESDKLAEKISQKINDRTIVEITHGQTDEELKAKVKSLLGDDVYLSDVTVSRVEPENLGNTVNREGTSSRFTFAKNTASAFKDITVKVLNNSTDDLMEKIKAKLDPESLSFVQDTSKEDIKNAILNIVRKDTSIANVNLEDFILDTNTVQTNQNVNLVFDLNGTKATLAKDISITAREEEARPQEPTLQEKINKALENLTEITIEHGKTDEELKAKVKQELDKTADTQGVTIATVSPENIGNTVNEAGSNVTFNFAKDSENASKEILVKLVKNVSDTSSEVAPPAPPSGDGTSEVAPPSGGSANSSTSSSTRPSNSSINHSSSTNKNLQNPNKENKTFKVSKIAGKNRVETAINVAKKLYPNGADKVILVNKDTYADSLSALALSNAIKAPILYTNINNIPESDLQAIKDLGVKNIVIVGGNSSVSDTQSKVFDAKGFNIERISGKDRFDTALKVSEILMNINKNADEIVIASGESYPDALSISSYSVGKKIPTILVNKDLISNNIKEKIKKMNVSKIYIIGGNKSISESVEKELEKILPKGVIRLSGKDRYETSMIVSKFAKPDASKAVIASGERFEDALIAGTLVANPDSTLLLGKKTYLTNSVDKYLQNSKIKNIDLVGGINTLGENYIEKLASK